jgi:hypothetical protein
MQKKVPFILQSAILIFSMISIILGLIFRKSLLALTIFHRISLISIIPVILFAVPFTYFKIIKSKDVDARHYIFGWYFLLCGYILGWLSSNWLNIFYYFSIIVLACGVVFLISGIFRKVFENRPVQKSYPPSKS